MESRNLFNKYDKVHLLKTGRTDWIIRVRAQAVWKGINRQTQEFRGLNVIFIDDSNSRIHAFLSAKICDLFGDALKEGCIYTLSNFHVRVYAEDEKNRAVRFEKHIYFANHTSLKVEEDNLTNIAPYAFDLYELSDVPNLLSDSRFLIDVVGIIEDRTMSVVRSKEDENRSHMKFRITDERTWLNVTFFNTLAEDLEKALKNLKEETVTIFIASAKVNEHEGTPCLNNYPATRFYLNIDHYSVKKLKERLLDPNFCPKKIELEEENIAPLMTVAEIKKLPIEYSQRKVRCQITVKKLEQKTNWYDNVCTSCGEEVNTVEGRYRCLKCVRNIPFPDKRFRLATICNDKTGILATIFPDDEIQRILGKNAFDVDDEIGEDVSFPPMLKFFEKKEYVLTLNIQENNVNKSSNVYIATKINDPAEMLGSHSPGPGEATPINEKSVSMQVDAPEMPKTSPPTAKSSNKVRSREKNENFKYELEENLPIGKFKVVKFEKGK